MAPAKSPEQSQKLREDFLELFVRSLIEHSYKPSKKQDFPLNELQRMQEEALKEKKDISERTNFPMSLSIMNQKKAQTRPQSSPQMPFLPAHPLAKAQPFPTMQMPKIAPQPMPSAGKGSSVNLGKVTSLLRDPSVFSVECPGPTKNVLVNRAGTIQTTPLTLTKEEINTLMENISDKTRIPLISGVFKAAYQDIIVTAVVSDFVGTRFIIQKMMPFQKY